MRVAFLYILVLTAVATHAQTLGGSSVFNFLNLPATPQLSALGGINISNQSNDAGLTYANPALIRKEMHAQLSANFNAF